MLSYDMFALIYAQIISSPRFLRDIHNDFHDGLGTTYMEQILGVPEVDQVLLIVATQACVMQ